MSTRTKIQLTPQHTEFKPSLVNISSLVGGLTVAEVVRRNRAATICDAIRQVAMIGGGAWLSYRVGGKQSLELYLRGLNHQAQSAS